VIGYLLKEMSKETAAVKLTYWQQVKDEIDEGMHPEIEQLQGRDRKAAVKKMVNARYAAEYGHNVEKGKIWDCSEVLSQTGYYTLALSNRQQLYFEQCEKNGLCSVNADPDGWWAVIKWNDKPPPGFFTDQQRREYDAFLQMIRDKINRTAVINPWTPLKVTFRKPARSSSMMIVCSGRKMQLRKRCQLLKVGSRWS